MRETPHPLIISVDFDDTIFECPTYPGIGNIIPDAKRVINKLAEEPDVHIIINSCRDKANEQMVIDALVSHGVKFHSFNENYLPLVEKYGETRKIGADIYIDNKNIFMHHYGWDEIEKELYRRLEVLRRGERYRHVML